MQEPVLYGDGFSYERTYIVKWMSKSQTSPLTREHVDNRQIIPNLTLKAAIQEFFTTYPHLVGKKDEESKSTDG